MDGAVLAVDRKQFGSAGLPDPAYNRPRSDQRLLVGQPQTIACLEDSQGDRQPCEAHDTVDRNVSHNGGICQCIDARQDLGAGGHPCRHVRSDRRVRHSNHLWTKRRGLFNQEIRRRGSPERDHIKIVRSGGDDVKGLGAYRPGRAEDCDGGRCHLVELDSVVRHLIRRRTGPTGEPCSRWPEGRTAGHRSGQGSRRVREGSCPCP